MPSARTRPERAEEVADWAHRALAYAGLERTTAADDENDEDGPPSPAPASTEAGR